MAGFKAFFLLFFTDETTRLLGLYVSVSASAALVRVIFSPHPRLLTTILSWIGSVIFGTLVGLSVHGIEAVKSYDIAACTMFGALGRELFQLTESLLAQVNKRPGIILTPFKNLLKLKAGKPSNTKSADDKE